MRKLFTLAFAAIAAASVSAQIIYPLDKNFNPQGVSNDGKIVGYYGPQSQYVIWNPMTGDEKSVTGSIAPGDGVGGSPEFSTNGKYIVGTFLTNYEFKKEWETFELSDIKMEFTAMCTVPNMENLVLAIGENTEGTAGTDRGVLLQDFGCQQWKSIYAEERLECIAFATENVGFVGGQNGLFAYTVTRGSVWESTDPRPSKYKDTEVQAYMLADFMQSEPYEGIVVALLDSLKGNYAIFQTPNGAETWDTTKTAYSKRWGAPTTATHVGNTFLIGTDQGWILRSEDKGLTWDAKMITTVNTRIGFELPSINSLSFSSDGKTGLAVGINTSYRTTDAGKTWQAITIKGDGATYNSAVWTDENTAIVVGDKAISYQSTDGGATWESIDIARRADFKTITAVKDVLVAGGVDAWYRQHRTDKQQVTNMGRYNVETGKIDYAGHLGAISDGISMSSGYGISGDGKTICGLASYADPTSVLNKRHAHAVAWTEEKGLMDLGSNYTNIGRSTRAEAMNSDGSIIVGWQDKTGPWKAAVWSRNEDGTYPTQNTPIQKDKNGSADDEKNLAESARTISQNGRWIGGQGRSINTAPLAYSEDADINNQPWIWSEETGYKRLGLPYEVEDDVTAIGYTSAVNEDGTMAAGFVIYGSNSMMAFVWTEEHGMLSLDEYLEDVLGQKLGQRTFCSVLDMSDNGRYLSAWGIQNNNAIFAACIDLKGTPTTGVDNVEADKNMVTAIYPNPATDVINIELDADSEATISILDLQGRTIMSETATAVQRTIDVAGLAEGVYLLNVSTENGRETHKITIAH